MMKHYMCAINTKLVRIQMYVHEQVLL